MAGVRAVLRLAFVAAVVLAATLGDLHASAPEPPGLPADPQRWICEKRPPSRADVEAWCRDHRGRGTPLPAELRDPPPVSDLAAYDAYNARLARFLTTQEYLGLGWAADARWRFSGPSVVEHGSYSRNYGPHFPLRVYYSPEIVAWLCDGRQGAIPDGAMIVKAMSVAWKALDVRTAADGCMDLASDPAAPIQPNLWAPMIKTSRASYDGWY
jgi:hypothetical protein